LSNVSFILFNLIKIKNYSSLYRSDRYGLRYTRKNTLLIEIVK
jgi:hypothetical protein